MGIRGSWLLLACLVLSGCGSSDAAGTDDNGLPTKISCPDLAKQAVDASGDQDVKLLKVRDPQPVTDHRDSVSKPTGGGEALVLACVGTGVYSDGETVPTRIRWTIDSDGTPFVFYRALR